MTKRNPFLVALWSILSFSVYYIYWLVDTKRELNERGAKIPSAMYLLFMLIPYFGILVFIWWLWKYCVGAKFVTKHEMSTGVSFILNLFLSVIGQGVLQSKYNLVSESTKS